MLDLFTKIIFEIVNVIFKVKDRTPPHRRAAKAFLQLHWILWRVEDHSRLFVEALDVILTQKRIPLRMRQAVNQLQADVHDLSEMLSEDIWGWPWGGGQPFEPGFWGIISLFDDPFANELNHVLGEKCTRLMSWDVLLRNLVKDIGDPEASKTLWGLPSNAGSTIATQQTIWWYNEDGLLQPLVMLHSDRVEPINSSDFERVDLTDARQVQAERDSAQATVEQLESLRTRLGELIKGHFDIKDLV